MEESRAQMSYITDLHQAYEKWLQNFDGKKLKIIEANHDEDFIRQQFTQILADYKSTE